MYLLIKINSILNKLVTQIPFGLTKRNYIYIYPLACVYGCVREEPKKPKTEWREIHKKSLQNTICVFVLLVNFFFYSRLVIILRI